MDSFQKVKQITREMMAKEQAHLVEARATNKSTQAQAEIYCKIVGIQMVYNAILEIEGKPAIK